MVSLGRSLMSDGPIQGLFINVDLKRHLWSPFPNSVVDLPWTIFRGQHPWLASVVGPRAVHNCQDFQRIVHEREISGSSSYRGMIDSLYVTHLLSEIERWTKRESE